jgi:hypothetical protein
METFDWHSFLAQWSWEWLEDDETAIEDIPSEVIVSRWLGYPGATEAQIAQAEKRLDTTFPPSYRAFLKVTNGWRWVNFIERLWSTEDVEWLAVRNQGLIDGWMGTLNAEPISDDVYFQYGNKQNSGLFRAQYLQTALEISKHNDGALFLLNPQVITPEGEWEAWFLASWYPGAVRYRSFQEMMQVEYKSFSSHEKLD